MAVSLFSFFVTLQQIWNETCDARYSTHHTVPFSQAHCNNGQTTSDGGCSDCTVHSNALTIVCLSSSTSERWAKAAIVRNTPLYPSYNSRCGKNKKKYYKVEKVDETVGQGNGQFKLYYFPINFIMDSIECRVGFRQWGKMHCPSAGTDCSTVASPSILNYPRIYEASRGVLPLSRPNSRIASAMAQQ